MYWFCYNIFFLQICFRRNLGGGHRGKSKGNLGSLVLPNNFKASLKLFLFCVLLYVINFQLIQNLIKFRSIIREDEFN